MYDKPIFELSDSERTGAVYPVNVFSMTLEENIDKRFLRKECPRLPQNAEIDVMRHFIALGAKNHHILKGFYPLGSCTMKYNPVLNEDIAGNEGFTEMHPYQSSDDMQGILRIMKELQDMLLDISGFGAISLQPVAGAHSEFAGMMIIREYMLSRGEKRSKILMPDSAHGTNPASCTLAGFNTVQLKSDSRGEIDLAELEKNMDEDTAGIMITNPNTLGIFETGIDKIAEIVHKKGGLVYMDGANLNALMGMVKPGRIGCDMMHFNLHKTFSTPHGGGGPGSGGIAVVSELKDFLPPFVIEEKEGRYTPVRPSKSIGSLHHYMGNVNIMIRAWAYLRIVANGVSDVTRNAVINANYLKKKLKDVFDLEYDMPTLHEFVLSGSRHKRDYGIAILDIAKRLLDYGMHAPTVYFPLIVPEALMIEPTETESRETLDAFIEAMKSIDDEAKTDPDKLHNAPVNTPVSRLNEIKALKDLNVNYYGVK